MNSVENQSFEVVSYDYYRYYYYFGKELLS